MFGGLFVSQQNGSTVLGWCLVAACVLAIPAGLMGRTSAEHEKKPATESSPFQPLLGKDRIQVIKLYGMIQDDNDSSSIFSMGRSTNSVKRKLTKALQDDHVKSVLLRINSPGGTIGMSQELFAVVEELRAKGKPVVVSMGDVAASGGYYVSAAADRVFADPGTLTGSIGVIMHLMNWQETEKKIGLQPAVIKSGVFKDIGSADRPMTPEERVLLQGLIMDAYDQFVTAVAKGRKMDKQVVKNLADGRIYSGKQALQNKLVDELGGYDQALAWTQKNCREKFHLSKDLDVDDGTSSSEMLTNLLSSAAEPASVDGQARSLIKGVMPVALDPTYNKIPLWMME
jgi:protease IV